MNGPIEGRGRLGGHDRTGEFSQDTGVNTPILAISAIGSLTTWQSGPRFIVSSEGLKPLQGRAPFTALWHQGPQTRGRSATY